MRSGLLFPDRDLDPAALPSPDGGLLADLGLDRVVDAMARGDDEIASIARALLTAPLVDRGAIEHRQAVLRDCLAAPDPIRQLHAVAVGAVDDERRIWGAGMRNAELVLRRAVDVLELLVGALRELRRIVEADAHAFRSEALRAFASALRSDVDDAFLAASDTQLRLLRERTLVATARLGPGNRATGHVLRRPLRRDARWRDAIGLDDLRGLRVDVELHDQNALNALAEVRALGVASAATAASEAAAHLLGFFRSLRAELGFYVGCLNLAESLAAAGGAVCFPVPAIDKSIVLKTRGLYEPALRLAIGPRVVPSDLDLADRLLVIVTGANGGGKSTLLRAVGIAQLMMQAGMFVAADAFAADLRSNVLTHVTHAETDHATGRLDAELRRLGELLDAARPESLVLLNESLASTNDREGSAVAGELIRALVDAGVRVWFVTHLHELAASLHAEAPPWAAFLRAERSEDGSRPFRLVDASPLPTSFAADVFRRVFDREPG